MSLREIICDEIRRTGPIPFSRYMELCLYHPELGYYSRTAEQFGKAGDFYTSSDVHAVFGRLLARQFDEMWRILDSPARIDLIELGPGRGLFARDVLDWSAEHFPEFAKALYYGLVEQSKVFRERLTQSVVSHVPSGRARVFDRLEEAAATACEHVIVFGNEFFDALPVEVIDSRGAVRVTETGGRFMEQFVAPSAEELEFLDSYGIHPKDGERVEICFAALSWARRIAESCQDRSGFVVFIDYGYLREDQLEGRHRDTLMTYRQHHASCSPYEAPGKQDITAHVNWTALLDTAERKGLELLGLLTQSRLLLGIGESTQFADAFQSCNLPQERAKVALQLQHLISPEGMGEAFKALVLSHAVPKEKAAQLSGLSFAR